MRRLLALGDSYTIGEGVEESGRWPEILVAALRSKGMELADPLLIARTAWTTDELLDAIEAEELDPPYDVVTLMVGVNDQYRGRPVSAFVEQFQPLLRRARRLAGGKARRVVVISIPDWGAAPFAEGRDRAAISSEIARFNERARTAAEEMKMQWVDLTESSRRMQDDRSLVVEDGLHPSAAMYEVWAAQIQPAVEKVLSR